MIPEHLLEQIAQANDIVDVIGGYFPLRRAGATFKARCPFHHEKTASFNVNPARQIFKCFGCGAGGGVFKFVSLYENIPFPEAVKRLAARAGIRVEEEPMDAQEDARQKMKRRLLALHAAAADWFHQMLMRTKAGQIARDYLKTRALSAEVAKSWKIGYAPDSWDALTNWARSEKFTEEELIASGLVTMKDPENPRSHFYDRFRDRLMFPICSSQGEVIAFSGRVLSADAFGGKYVNSPETPLFIKGNVLFGIHKTMRALIDKKAAIVCEGQIDLITAFESGVQNVTATQGTAFTSSQARILKRYVDEVILCYDADAAGVKASERSLPALLEAGLGVRVAEMPAGHDPDSLIRAEGAEAFAAQIAQARDYFEFRLRHAKLQPEFATPRGKSVFARQIAESVALLSDPVQREGVILNVSRELEIAPAQFVDILNRLPKQSRLRSSREGEGGNNYSRRAMRNGGGRNGDGGSNGGSNGSGRDSNGYGGYNGNDAGDGELDSPPLPRLAPMNNTTRMLCQLALTNTPARAWLLEQEWEPLLAPMPEAELLVMVLRASIDPDAPASVNLFLATCGDEEQSALAGLLDARQPLLKPDEDPLRVARDCWRDLQRRDWERLREIAAARARRPGLSPEEMLKYLTQAHALQQQLNELNRQKNEGGAMAQASAAADAQPPAAPVHHRRAEAWRASLVASDNDGGDGSEDLSNHREPAEMSEPAARAAFHPAPGAASPADGERAIDDTTGDMETHDGNMADFLDEFVENEFVDRLAEESAADFGVDPGAGLPGGEDEENFPF